MVEAAWKKLKAEDFMSPNPVLCCNGGQRPQGLAAMLSNGINIVAMVDEHRQGSMKVEDKQIPYLLIEQAIEMYGAGAAIIITGANMRVFQDIRTRLLDYGFSPDKIFDLNMWTWLTVPAAEGKSYCKYFGTYMQYLPTALSKCCNSGVIDAYLCEWFIGGRSLRESIENFLEKRLYYLEESKNGRIPLRCRNCPFLTRDPGESGEKITEFVVSDHAYCNADCVYCDDACSIPRKYSVATAEERYEAILYGLVKLQQENILDERAVVQLAGGEITIHPRKKAIYKTILEVLQRSPELQLQFLSNCMIYDQEIADLLSLGKNSFLQCDVDSGTPETYIKIKGFNAFDTVCKHLKQYARHGTVKLKYVILPGWNDSQADYEGSIRLLKELGGDELVLSLEFGVSRDGDRMRIREALYAAARFMALLEESGIRAVFPDWAWKSEHLAVAKRLCREIKSLNETGAANEEP